MKKVIVKCKLKNRDDFEKKMEAKSVIHNSYAEQGVLKVEEIGEELFGDVPEIKEEFTEKLEKYKLPKVLNVFSFKSHRFITHRVSSSLNPLK